MYDPLVRNIVETAIHLSPTDAYISTTSEQRDGIIEESFNNTRQFVLDTGLIKQVGNIIYPGNLFYYNVIMRYIAQNILNSFSTDLAGKWMGGHIIDMNGLLKSFQKWWAENDDGFDKKK
ncbi:MAG: hypothetical protein LBR53_04875 [Deltaproteobacteria bacterium]|jgi:hypothetical protein|nr:hypothetical protein [Deltaproteobacteria bacterium]